MSNALQVAPGGNTSAGEVIAPDRSQTAVAAAVSQAKAEVEARYLMARAQPRDMNVVYQRLMKECDRPSFADSAMYSRPVGGGKSASGLSIRFAEAALRSLGNTDVSSRVIYDDEDRRMSRVTVTDLETNTHFSEDIVLEKTVERKTPPKGTRIISQRVNSYNELTYTIPATEVDLIPKQRALESKAVRNCTLRLIPGDFQDDAKAAIGETRRREDRSDPKAALKRLLLGFANLNVPADQLSDYLGHSVDQISADEVGDLRNVFAAVRDGEMLWHETLAERRSERTAGKKAEPKKGAKAMTLDDLKAKGAKSEPSPMPEPTAEEQSQRADCEAAIEEAAAGGKNADAILAAIREALEECGADSVDALPSAVLFALFAKVEALR